MMKRKRYKNPKIKLLVDCLITSVITTLLSCGTAVKAKEEEFGRKTEDVFPAGQAASSQSYCDIYGHSYRSEYEWSENASWARIILTCRNDPSHRETYFMNITSKIKKYPTCIEWGITTYIATAVVDGIVYIDRMDLEDMEIDPSNHSGKVIVLNAQEATAEQEGYTGDTYCASCGAWMSDGRLIPRKESKPGTTVSVKKSVTVELGKKLSIGRIVRNTAAFQKMTLSNASKYKNYFKVNQKTGTITTKKYFKTKIQKSIPVKVRAGGKVYTVKVNIKIPAPKVKVSKKLIRDSKGARYRYTFKYNIKGAAKIKVRMKRGGSSKINKEFDRYISKPKSNKNSFIQYSEATMRKLKNKVTFKIVAYYGKNQSETLTVTK